MTSRQQLAEKIKLAKVKKKVTWPRLAEAVGKAPAWTTAALLGQMSMSAEEAGAVGRMLDLTEDDVALLQTVPYRGSLPPGPPTDPLVYRFYELVQVYGTTFKALIEEEFGDGIMSAIDFSMDLQRVADPKGDRVQITLNGKFLPYKKY
ncbi:MAG: cyanase [Phycisphaerae bacterium]